MCFSFILPPQSTEQVLHSDHAENPPSVRSLDLKGTCGPAPQFCKKKVVKHKYIHQQLICNNFLSNEVITKYIPECLINKLIPEPFLHTS